MAAKVIVEARDRRIMGASFADLVTGLLAQRPIQQLLREFRALVFQEPGILLHTAIQRHADLPGPRKDLRILDSGLIVESVRTSWSVALHHMQGVTVEVPGAVEPGILHLTGHI